MLCTVVNRCSNKYDVYIGRGSKWGNPYSHKNNTKAIHKVDTREDAIKSYEEWITNGEGSYLLKDLHELKGKILGCYCKPKSCHGDILVKLVNRLEIEELYKDL
jgi:hypothetical protein